MAEDQESPPPGPSRHERVKQVFMDALDAPPGKRAAFLTMACEGDEQLRREVLELFVALAGHGEERRPLAGRRIERVHEHLLHALVARG
ncbi:MAG TPA: hypothetical protein VNM39_03500, partial [Verrucomicrobiae bacterium]|nr:hypothetical protein [Verrucomicrobiae bacterium]